MTRLDYDALSADSQDAMDSASAATGDNSGGAVSALCSILQEKKPWNGENCNGKTGATGGGDGTCKDRCLVCSVCNNFSSKKINVMQHLLANHNIGNELLAQDFPSLSVPSTIQKKPFDYLRTLTEARSAQNLRLIEKVTFMNDSFALKENCNDLKHGNLAEILENYMGGKSDGEKVEKNQAQTVSCPLCPETFLDQVNVETHVIRVHNIKMEGLNRLLKLVDTSQFLKTTKQQQLGSPDKSPKKESSPSPEIKCSFCKVCFDSMVDLKIHCNESNHFKRNADSEDLACFLNDCKDAFDNLSDLHHHFKANHLNFLISENHTYKYRCKLCPFAFKTHEKLNRHLFYHSLRESTKCFYCDAHFKNINSLTSHIAEKHPQESSAPKGANESHQESASILFFKDLKRKMMNSKNGMSPKSDRSQTRDSADEDRLSEKSMSSKSSFYYDKSLDGSDGGGGGGAAGSKFACNDCRFSFTDSAALERHMATAFHMSKEREKAAADSIAASAVNSKQQLFYDIKSEKFTNPNRPFKCTICMESFTQKNILLVHYNSVSHLNKLKKFKSDKQQQQQQFQFGLGASMGDSGDGCEHEGKQQQQQQQQDFKAFGLPMFMQEAGEKRKDIEEKETARKKFKCDICNVAYTQGSTLDIHMRSVLHQTRACRLQERSMFSNQLQGTEKKKSDFPLIQTIPESHESPNFIDDTPMRKIKSPAELQQQQQQQQPLPQPQIPQQPPPMLNPMMGALGMGAMAAVDKPEIALCECCFQVFPNKATLETHLELSPECSAVKKKMMENNPSPENFADGFQQQVLNELAKVNSLPGFDLTPEALLGKTPFPLDPTANLMDPNFLKNASLLQFATDPNNKLGPNALNVLNFMHFHHLMSLSYLNLAPQLNFGAVPPKVPDMTGKSDLEKAISADKAKMQSVGMPQNLNGKSPLEMNLMAHNLESKMPPQPPQQQPCTQKRARTRITDEQLRILRSHFDINNSPSEESIQEMSLKANLPPKVVKHWFRNTLFKERQRSKDSPYNFSIPPSTKLNVEEYERTGETKVTDLETSYKSNESQDLSQNAVDLKMNEMKQNFSKSLMESLSKHQATQEMGNFQLNKNLFPDTFNNDFQPQHDPTPQLQVNVANFFSQTPDLTSLSKEIMSNKKKKIKSESSNESPISADLQIDSTNSSPLPMRPPSVISLKKHMDNRSHGNPVLMEEMKIPSPIDSPVISPPVSMAGGMHQQMTPNQSVTCSNGKRANRTRFTDYQIKVLQEFFENNSYPKDSDLEYLSKLLMLSPRVIVVWFQNARQKQRKIYENQPNPTFETDEKKAININYTCKKCNLVFQRYYELIRHQKNHCFKEESNKRSAKAQLAAAQIAHSFTSGSEDSDSSLDVSRRDFQPRENDCPF